MKRKFKRIIDVFCIIIILCMPVWLVGLLGLGDALKNFGGEE